MPDTPSTPEEWHCRGCGAAFPGSPPWHHLCDTCLGHLKWHGFGPDPAWPAEETPPLCGRCGGPLIPVVRPELAEAVSREGR